MPERSFRLFLDENLQAKRLRTELSRAGFDVVGTRDRSLDGASDLDVLNAAHAEARALVTRNCADFLALGAAGYPHAGVFLVYHDRGQMSDEAIVRSLVRVDELQIDPTGQILTLNAFA